MKPTLITCFNCGRERWFAISLFFLTAANIFGSISHAEPFIPVSADVVIVAVPNSIAALNRLNETRRLKFSNRKSNLTIENSLPKALENARRYITLAKNNNDNRWYGFAQSTLAPWWDNNFDNIEIALIKAHLFLLDHKFPAALTELQKVLDRQTQHPEALSMRANTYIMLGKYTLAQSDCQKIMIVANPVLGVNCLARIKSLSGSGRQALDHVLQILNLEQELSPLEKLETHINAAVFAHRLNEITLANEHYTKALAINPQHRYLVEQYSDFLIEHAQWDLLAQLINSNSNSNSKHLDQRIKFAQYLVQKNDPAAPDLLSQIEEEFKQLQIIDDDFPHKEYAGYLLTKKGQAHTALGESLKNWQVQQDPSSALLVLRCSLAARNTAQAQPVVDWVRRTGLVDHRITQAFDGLTRLHTAL